MVHTAKVRWSTEAELAEQAAAGAPLYLMVRSAALARAAIEAAAR